MSDPDVESEFRLAPSSPGIGVRTLGWLGARTLWLQRTTWRVHIDGSESLDEMLAEGQPVLLAFWHGKYLPLLTLLHGRNICVFSTRSFRGKVIREICRHFGYTCFLLARGQGDRTLDVMEEAMAPWNLAGLAVDGPIGPNHFVRPGAIKLAAALGLVVVPVTSASRRKHVIARRWDRMELPALFTRVALVIGESIQIPSALTRKNQLYWDDRLGESLAAADRKAEEMLARF